VFIVEVKFDLEQPYCTQVPYVLSIGEGAAAQQREREDETYIGENQFAKRARQEKAKKDARKGTR
jgi:rRNA processing protein Gar1